MTTFVLVAEYRNATDRMFTLANAHYCACTSNAERRSWRSNAIRHLAELEKLGCERASERDRRCFVRACRLLGERIAMVSEQGEVLARSDMPIPGNKLQAPVMTNATLATTSFVTAEKTHWDAGFQNMVLTLTRQGFSADKAYAYSLNFTRGCFHHARMFSQKYQGDFWCWYEQSDGGFFIYPKTEKIYPVVVHSNYFKGAMSAQALGITVSLYTLCILAESEHDFFIDSYYRLRDFAVQHPEWAAIGGAID